MKLIGEVFSAKLVLNDKSENYAYIDGVWYAVSSRPLVDNAQTMLSLLISDYEKER